MGLPKRHLKAVDGSTAPTEPWEQRFRLLVESVTDYAIFMIDAQGYVQSWNAGAARIKGYAPHEIIGQHFSRFYPQAAIDRRPRFLRAVHPHQRLGFENRDRIF